jgi:uncharacterized protein
MTFISIPTTDGIVLEAELREAPNATALAVLAHPNPTRGGTFDSPVITGLQQAFHHRDITSLRFNFRGTGASTGTHDNGDAERSDVIAAITTMHERFPLVPVHLVGYSFGARVILSVQQPTVASWVGIAPPLTSDPFVRERTITGHSNRTKLLLIPEHDQFCQPTAARELVCEWNATTLDTIEGVDHFLGDSLPWIVDRIVAHITSTRKALA